MRRKKFSTKKFIKERNKKLEAAKETKPTVPFGPGSHQLYALQMRQGFVKPRTIKSLEKKMHKKKQDKIFGGNR